MTSDSAPTDPPPTDPHANPSQDPMREAAAEADALESAYRFLMANRDGVLNFDDNYVPVKFVTDNSTGRLVLAAPVATFFVHQHVLFVPDEADDSMQMIVSPEQIDECPATDRWQAFHGEPEHVRWAMCWVDSVKLDPWVFDGDALTRPNALATSEPGLIKELNADKAALAALCKAASGAAGEPPTVEAATSLFETLFFDSERYDLAAVGRVKMNMRLALDAPDTQRTLRRDDIVACIKALVELRDGKGDIDDIDHLGNRRVRSVGELMENQYRIGLLLSCIHI